MTWVDDRLAELRAQDRAWFEEHRGETERLRVAELRVSTACDGMGIDGWERLADAAERIVGGG